VRSWTLPLAGPVLRRFDPPPDPYGPGHRGVDLGGSPGDPVVSAGAGTVTFAAVLAGRGVVTVTHAGGLRTTYEPLAVSVHRGATVTRGAVLGRLTGGHPGCPWPACLHWGLLRDKTYLDPLTLIRRGPVRLLPLPSTP
jgi:murein DD-endopeptidase MepM/ murein hydrolase activator NlpD